MMNKKEKLLKLNKEIYKIYLQNKGHLLFHGWHHINFVRNKALMFGKNLKADLFIIESTALVHDLNYLVKSNSEPEVGKQMRQTILAKIGYTKTELEEIEKIILASHTAYRNKKLSNEAKSISDADTLFKALPITPILFANHYIIENKIDISKLAKKVINEQTILMKKGIYFYTKEARQKYLKWAKINLTLWSNVNESLQDKDVQNLLADAKKLKVI
jgi:uncharacterized protein